MDWLKKIIFCIVVAIAIAIINIPTALYLQHRDAAVPGKCIYEWTSVQHSKHKGYYDVNYRIVMNTHNYYSYTQMGTCEEFNNSKGIKWEDENSFISIIGAIVGWFELVSIGIFSFCFIVCLVGCGFKKLYNWAFLKN